MCSESHSPRMVGQNLHRVSLMLTGPKGGLCTGRSIGVRPGGLGGKLPGSRGRKSPGARSLPASPDRGHSVSAWVGTPGSVPLCGRINLLFQKFPSLGTSGGSPTAERAPVLTPAQPEGTWESLDAGSQSTATQGPTQPTVMLAMITKQ